MTDILATPLALPCGAILPNRLAKAAMSEGIADADNHATPRLVELYRRWAGSGAGLLLSGNIQVDPWHLERPGNVVLDDESGLGALAEVAAAGKSGGAHFWAQISHTGRQVAGAINAAPLSPSNVELDVVRGAGYSFATPRAMTGDHIASAIRQFAHTAKLARAAGFTGVELHAAHGYLISQFLSPLANRRTDRWGGSLDNRARFLLETIGAVRAAVGADFPIGIKLNSSDFQRGGFTNAECIELVGLLNHSTLDLLELSGGSLEQPKVVGVALKDEGVDGRPPGTKKREAYFIEFAGAVRAAAKMPVMMVGGFRTAADMAAAIESGDLDVVGLGRPVIADPRTPAKLLSGEISRAPAPESSIDLFHLLPWFNAQIERLSDGLDPDLSLGGQTAAAMFKEREDKMFAALLARRSRNAAQAMAIAKLAHYSVRTRDLEASRLFYTEILGLEVGRRPPFPFPGLWLYPDDEKSELAAVHLIGVDAVSACALETYLGGRRDETRGGTGALDHIAFLATDWQSLRERCERRSVPFAERVVPGLGLLQVFLTDPSGVTIELNYAASEAGSAVSI